MNHSQTYSYNARGMNTGVLDAANGMSTAVYDTMGNLTRLTGPTGATTHYTYDNMGRLSTETTASGGTIRYEYDELNLKDKLTNARGQVKTYVNDAMGRVSGIVSTQDTVSYTYDDNGNVKTVTDSNGTITRDYDALNRVSRYVDTFGREIGYQYDAVGNLQRITYPDDTYVTYGYDENNNLTSVTDWQGRITSYGYNENNQVITVTKPDGSVTTTVYDDRQRIWSTVERTASGAIITGYEYTYDTIGRISSEKHLAQDVTLWYTYDALSRVTKRTVKNACNTVVSEETYTYDAAGNITDAPDSCFGYGTNNRLTTFMERSVSYDADGNMLSARLGGANMALSYDASNRLVSAGGHTYTYNAEDVRIRNVCNGYDTTYTYNTNGRLSQLLLKTTNGITTKYVYGLGLIGEEKCGEFKTYHFDYRGSTVALTDECGSITDTFEYDTYGNVTERTGDSFVIFGYNGRDGVVTDKNGLIYMRARYYSPEMRRFVNADILRGEISDSTSLNRYSYVNGNPVSFVDPFGLSKERGCLRNVWNNIINWFQNGVDSIMQYTKDFFNNIDNHKDYWALLEQNAVDSAIAIGYRAAVVDNTISISMTSEEEEIDRIVKYLGLQRACDLIAESACDKFLEENGREFMLSDACVSNEILEHIEAYNWAVGKTSQKNDLVSGYYLKQQYNKLMGKGSKADYADSVYKATESIDMRESDIKIEKSFIEYYSSQAYVFNYEEGLREEYIGTQYDPWADKR